MTCAPSLLADLLADCEAHGIRLALAGDGGLTIDALQVDLTPDLLARLKAHKADLTLLGAKQGDETVQNRTPKKESDTPTKAVCRCGATTWRDVPIHGGQSVRRDCGRCGRFLDFPVWYGLMLDIMSSNG